MNSFEKTFDLTDIDVVEYLIDYIGEAHVATQQLEAGIASTKLQQAEATFYFLDIIGFLPNVIQEGTGKIIEVADKGLRAVGDKFFFVDSNLDNGKTATFPLLGPGSDPTTTLLLPQTLVMLIQKAFPRATAQVTTGKSKDGHKVYHTTVRPAFMQRANTNGFPLASGSAVCSNESVALMQATIRMLADFVSRHIADAEEKVQVGPSKTLLDFGREKYGHQNFNDMVKRMMGEPNSLLTSLPFKSTSVRAPDTAAVLLKDQPKAKDNGVYVAKESTLSDKAPMPPIGPTISARQYVDELVESLQALGIDVKVIKL